MSLYRMAVVKRGSQLVPIPRMSKCGGIDWMFCVVQIVKSSLRQVCNYKIVLTVMMMLFLRPRSDPHYLCVKNEAP